MPVSLILEFKFKIVAWILLCGTRPDDGFALEGP
jgi:hypothetical protein